ncbi:helix-turn-helix domain-containing protein [Amycolatopsis tucumanensis]|uniref:helix-turn-helix domain-containing protein n=1 Tax=Amycolatopsis tucumanensis TaxID=401106 RepID=UPI003D74772F
MTTDARRLSAPELERLRRRAVAAVTAGLSQGRVATMLGVSRKTVGVWVRAYQASGEQAFPPQRRGRRVGECLALSGEQQDRIVAVVAAGLPDAAGLPHLLWTRRAVTELVEREFGIRISPATADRYLTRWGLTGPREHVGDGLAVRWTAPRGLHALVAVTNRGLVFFRAGRLPFDVAQLVDFRNRLRMQLAREVTAVVTEWPAAQGELLERWCSADRNVIAGLTIG